MEQMITNLIERFPTFLGLVLLAYVLYRQNQQMLNAWLGQLEGLRKEIRELIEAIRNTDYHAQ